MEAQALVQMSTVCCGHQGLKKMQAVAAGLASSQRVLHVGCRFLIVDCRASGWETRMRVCSCG